jgi:hypothetical protein
MAADWNRLAEHLRRSGDVVTLSWRELDDLVGGMPRSALDHAAFWSGDRAHTRAWRGAGFEVVRKRPGVEVTFGRRNRTARQAPSTAAGPAATEPGDSLLARPDLLLVTCVKAKAASPRPARDLYVSPLFRKQRAYAEGLGVPWFILSAEHGLVGPDEWLAPYERYLPDTPPAYQEAWGRWVVARLALLAGELTGRVVEIHASSDYVRTIEAPLREQGAVILEPLKGLRPGERLAWYGEAQPPTSPPTAPIQDLEHVLATLADEPKAMTPAELQAHGADGLKVPGLYSWWIDERGADDLTAGLGHPVRAGLVYAGLAGATRWPSGKRSSNTLWGRLDGMHLGARHEFSTFRRTIGAALAAGRGWTEIDEHELTRWMHAHLRVVALPFPDADELGRMEAHVLRALDPPLNLKDVPPSPLRARLKELRRQFAAR